MEPQEDPENPFPPSRNGPRIWLLTSGATPLAIYLAKALLANGDYVAAGVAQEDRVDQSQSYIELVTLAMEYLGDDPASHGPGNTNFNATKQSLKCARCGADWTFYFVALHKVWHHLFNLNLPSVAANGRPLSALVGTIEEVAQRTSTQLLVRDQFHINYFGMVNIITVTIPQLRKQDDGHIIILTGVTGHIGTPGLGIHCAASWALEGFCDSLAFEVAPFNIKVTIVQPNLEVNVLTNKIHFAPQMPEYTEVGVEAYEDDEDEEEVEEEDQDEEEIQDNEKEEEEQGEDGSLVGHNIREKLQGALAQVSSASLANQSSIFDGNQTIRPNLTLDAVGRLVEETVYTLISIGGHDSPPARHIVGNEGVAAVKEKLKTVSEELEDFSDVGISVDYTESENLAMDKEKQSSPHEA
ncbi:MAG: hypothetical protein M1814_005862 [Vezdaea aestivalis]|nr:MAG: hypothetical protein M1814_005862 [Vezdaea aestivalis]